MIISDLNYLEVTSTEIVGAGGKKWYPIKFTRNDNDVTVKVAKVDQKITNNVAALHGYADVYNNQSASIKQ
jgi:type IV pilus biogenesis protein CpaD/CtpE